ncbi:DUF4126 domain-containing protein [Pyxidicoccus trucidator]|uniref:DUF4126 domain-containing protein n=1 Tax=Pyxidicoccus trucidator TaxID=2709662 RepID=UPI0013DBAC82|nr:DUF4126 domain-containing protein [Pyxidicoccus trucidator]
MISFAILSQLIGLSSASGTRAGASLLLVAAASHFHYVALPPEMAWMATPEAMGTFVALLAFEMYTQRDADLRLFLGLAQFSLSAASGAVVAMASMGVQTEQLPPWAVGAVGAGIAVATYSMRQRLQDSVGNLETDLAHPYRWLLRMEDFVALAVAAAAILFAPLALALVIVFTVGCVVAGLFARRLEGRSRRPCPAGCGASIRKEASRCPKCRADVPVLVKLELRLAGRAQDAIRGALKSAVDGGATLVRRKTG